jgi:dolichyl-phosphate beta-glucosyltransferase
MASSIVLSIIIPAYNEAQRIPATLQAIAAYLQTWKHGDVEVIVVDDGSSDDTVRVVREFAQQHNFVRVIENRVNKGKGGVVAQGMLQAEGAWRLFIDADGSTPIDQLDRLWPHTKLYDIVIGSRHLDPKSIKIKQGLPRRVFSRVVNRLLQATVLPGVVDTQCGFKLFSAAATTTVFGRQQVRGWLFDAELLTIARQHGLTIHEVPVDWYDAAQSKLRAARTMWRTSRELMTIWQNAHRGVYKR